MPLSLENQYFPKDLGGLVFTHSKFGNYHSCHYLDSHVYECKHNIINKTAELDLLPKKTIYCCIPEEGITKHNENYFFFDGDHYKGPLN